MITPTLTLGQDNGNERAKLPVIGSSGATQQNGNYSITQGVDFALPGRELYISNDSQSNITINVNLIEGGVLSFVLLPIETIDERLMLFSRVDVTATGNWRWYVRGNAS